MNVVVPVPELLAVTVTVCAVAKLDGVKVSDVGESVSPVFPLAAMDTVRLAACACGLQSQGEGPGRCSGLTVQTGCAGRDRAWPPPFCCLLARGAGDRRRGAWSGIAEVRADRGVSARGQRAVPGGVGHHDRLPGLGPVPAPARLQRLVACVGSRSASSRVIADVPLSVTVIAAVNPLPQSDDTEYAAEHDDAAAWAAWRNHRRQGQASSATQPKPGGRCEGAIAA